MKRIYKRNRKEEENKISLDYLKMCHAKHVDWINNTNTNTITINGHRSVENIKKRVTSIINTLN